MLRKFIPAMLLVVLVSTGALADGMIFPVERPNSTIVVPGELFTVKYHDVSVEIQDQLCTTKVDQIFHNDTSVQREGMYIFPMPDGSAITKFSMFDNEKEIVGRILDRNEARNIYESIVRQRKDPALLEYIDRNTFRARVFPIPANGDKRIKLSYAEVAGKVGNSFRYVYPLSTERFSAKPLQTCKVVIHLKCKRPITNIYSPTHTIDIDRFSEKEVTVQWQAKDVKPDTDLVLYYTVSDREFGMDMVAYREKGQPGYFMLLASPRPSLDKARVQPKNVVFVLDRTGSMAGEKIDQAKKALAFCLNSLKEQDHFNIIMFNESPSLMLREMTSPTKEVKREVLAAINKIEANGSTDINQALKGAKKQFAGIDSPRNYVVFLTDGLPTAGTTDPDTILRNAKMDNAKVFAFGVGYDVNVHLLDKLAEQNHGSTDYVRPNEDIEAKVSTFFAKVSDPVLADVSLDISGAQVSDRFPAADMPDVFSGTQLIIFGRYTGSGPVKVTLSGMMGSQKKSFALVAELPEIDEDNEFIPQLWAARKIGYLLDEIRLHSNKELIDEVVRLSKTYGIPTEYTSFLADERQTADSLRVGMDRTRLEAAKAIQYDTGAYSVAQSSNANMSRNSAQVPSAPAAAAGGYAGSSGGFKGDAKSRVVGKVAANSRIGGTYQDRDDRMVIVANVQNVARRTFYQRGSFWEDADLKPSQNMVQIKQFSEAHFQLLRAYPKLSQYSTLGNVRVILENKQAVEIGPNGKEKLTDEELRTLTK